MSVLVIAECHDKQLSAANAQVIQAASELPGDVHVLLLGDDLTANAEALSAYNDVNKVITFSNSALADPLAENYAPIIVSLAKDYSHILAPASTFGKNLLPRVAALLDVMQVSDVIKIIDEKTFERPIYAGNAIATVSSNDNIKLLTIRTTAFAAAEQGSEKAEIHALEYEFASSSQAQFIELQASKSERPELTSAEVIVSGGRALQSAENFKLIEQLADKLNAAIGASRAAVDAGFVPNDYQVGQTGKIVAPKLYIAIGISGAIQHLAGMKDSQVIVAINKDEEAPIFSVADYGLVGDLFEIVPQLIAGL